MITADWHDDIDRKEETLAIIADLLGFSWTGKLICMSQYFYTVMQIITLSITL